MRSKTHHMEKRSSEYQRGLKKQLKPRESVAGETIGDQWIRTETPEEVEKRVDEWKKGEDLKEKRQQQEKSRLRKATEKKATKKSFRKLAEEAEMRMQKLKDEGQRLERKLEKPEQEIAWLQAELDSEKQDLKDRGIIRRTFFSSRKKERISEIEDEIKKIQQNTQDTVDELDRIKLEYKTQQGLLKEYKKNS